MRIPEKKIKTTFAKAHKHLDVIGSALEALEMAVRADNYPNANGAFGEAYGTAANDLDHVLSEDLARLCDAINPAVEIRGRAEEAEKLGAELNEQLNELQIGLDHEDAEAVTKAFSKALDAAVRIREIVEDDVSVLLDKIDHGYGAQKEATDGLSSEDVKNLLMALGRGQSEFTDWQAERLVDWAKEIRISNAMLDLILEGRAVPSIDMDGEVKLESVELQS